MKTKLKPKEQCFCRLIAQACAPAEAAVRAGYRLSPAKAADRLLNREDVRRTIEQYSAERCRRSAVAGYERIAFGSAADAVRLCFADGVPEEPDALDLYLVSEIKRSKNGVEVKLFDRMKALDRLCELDGLESDRAEPFYRALEESARRLSEQG